MTETPKELGVKFETKRGARLLKVREACEEAVLDDEIDAMIKNYIMGLLDREIAKEREKIK